jgi:hypothetical protein
MKPARVSGQASASVVVVFEMVANGNHRHIGRRLDLDESDVARPPNRDDQFVTATRANGTT